MCKTILIGGEAGQGIKSAGKILSYALLFQNLNVNLYDEYPSLIRGGHNDVFITFSEYPVYSPNSEIDIMICLDKKTFEDRKDKLNLGSILLYDNSTFHLPDEEIANCSCEVFTVNANNILNSNKLPQYCKNTIYVSFGLVSLGVDIEISKRAIERAFQEKPDKIKENLRACEITYQTQKDIFGIRKISQQDTITNKSKKLFISGNEAVGMGAIEAKIGFYAAYPMTPASTLLDFMFKNYQKYNIVVKQTEDEISAINMAIGASFAGARSMVGTSGGGFSLMVEGLGLAAITETPLVIFLSQRPGPATGMATWTSQSDLQFVLHASQDEFPRVVFTPTDNEEARELTFRAFNIADKYQIPVFILSDKYLSESYSTFEYKQNNNDKKVNRGLLLSNRALWRIENFKRYEFTESGISPRSIPGQANGIYLANSDESDEKGYSSEDSQIRLLKMQKRAKKVKHISSDMPELNIYGDYKSKICLITWGSTKGAALEATRRLQSIGINIKLLALNYIEPFPKDELEKILHSVHNILIAEGNFSGQLSKILKQHLKVDSANLFTKYDGRPIFPNELVDFIKNSIKK